MKNMIRILCTLFCAAMLAFAAPMNAPASADVPGELSLRARVEASGRAITLGDVFTGAGAEAGRAIAPAPPAGQMTSLSPAFLAAAARSAGFTWTPPSGLNEVRVVTPGGARALLAPANASGASNYGVSANLVQRGDSIALVFSAPGVTMSARARALEAGSLGQSIRVSNLQSNRIVDAVVTGSGAAEAAR
jgi:hypothetical protein